MSEIRVIHNQARAAIVREEKDVKRAAVYCRVSTLQEEQADSYETQRAYYTRLIDADPGLVLAGIYGDHGVSGLSAEKRPEFKRMMDDCMIGKADVVMTKSVSRFARNLADCVNCVRLLKEKGIPVIFDKEGFSSDDGDCEFILSVLAIIAQEESNNLSRHINWSLENRNASGNPSRVVRYGYKRVISEDGKTLWNIDETEAERVRLAFRLAREGENCKRIVAALNGVEIEKSTGVRWSRYRVREMLKSEIYIGDVLTNKRLVADYLSKRVVKNTGQRTQYYLEGHHEPIIDRDTFARVGEMISRDAL